MGPAVSIYADDTSDLARRKLEEVHVVAIACPREGGIIQTSEGRGLERQRREIVQLALGLGVYTLRVEVGRFEVEGRIAVQRPMDLRGQLLSDPAVGERDRVTVIRALDASAHRDE